ncbi:MAG: heptosyltransferase-2 [Planctomycetota bacterium]|jgi:heptosyltransferase-2
MKREHLVIRAPNWVGDLVMATPVLEAACGPNGWPKVTIAMRKNLAPLLQDGHLADRIVIVDKRSEARVLRDLNADAIMLLTNSLGAAWRAFRAGIPVRAGAALGIRRALLTHGVVPATSEGRRVPIPTAHLHRDIAGLLDVQVPNLHPRLAIADATRERMTEVLRAAGLGEGERYVACAPGAAFGAAKLWPPKFIAIVLDELWERRGLRAVITCGPGEESLVHEVVRAARTDVISLAESPRDLIMLAPLIADSELLVVGDSGPRWLAAAFDVPCVSIMGPNFPELTASSLEWCEIVRREDLECSPCLRRVCPLGHHECMQGLPPSRVLDAGLGLLDRRAAFEQAELEQLSLSK